MAEAAATIAEALKAQAPEGALAKGITPSTDKRKTNAQSWVATFHSGSVPIRLGNSWPTEASALQWSSVWVAHLQLDNYDVSDFVRCLRLTGLVGGMKNNLGSAVLAHVRSCCPDLKDYQPEALCHRACSIRTRLTAENSLNFVPALNTATNKLEFARMCTDSESQCAVAMLQRVHCVGPPGQNICPHAHLRCSTLDAFSHWCRVDYDHGPYAEVAFIQAALIGLLLASQGSLAGLCRPLLLHLMYSTEWGELQTEGGGTVQIGPNLAPRCSRRTIAALVKRGGAQEAELLPKGGSCHAICGKSWVAQLAMNRDLLGDTALLTLTPAVLRSSPAGADIISQSALTFVTQYNSVYGLLGLAPLAAATFPADADLPKWRLHGGASVPKWVVAALIIQLQQAAAIDIAKVVGLLCCLLAAALPLSWRRARALLSGLCFGADFVVLFICACLVGGMDWSAVASRALAGAGLALRVCLPHDWLAAMHRRTYRLAALLYIASIASQLETVSTQPWDVLLPALMWRIAVKATTYLCLEWLSGYAALRTLRSPYNGAPLASMLS